MQTGITSMLVKNDFETLSFKERIHFNITGVFFFIINIFLFFSLFSLPCPSTFFLEHSPLLTVRPFPQSSFSEDTLFQFWQPRFNAVPLGRNLISYGVLGYALGLMITDSLDTGC